MKSYLKSAVAVAMGAAMPFLGASAAQAATLTFGPDAFTYNNADPRPDWNVVIDDLTAGAFRVNVSLGADSTGVGDILGFGFDTVLEGLTLADLTFVSSSTGDVITGLFGNGTDSQSNCGMACNFSGTGQLFDYIVRLGTNGTSSGLNTTFEFLIDNVANVALSASTFTAVGIRSQGVGAGPGAGNGSSKDFTGPGEGVFNGDLPPSEVPLPASALLLLSGLMGLGFMGRYKRSGLNTAG